VTRLVVLDVRVQGVMKGKKYIPWRRIYGVKFVKNYSLTKINIRRTGYGA
jgi:hypothetical protein